MTVGSARTDAGCARSFVKRETLRPVFGDKPACSCDQRLFEVPMMVAVSGELGVRRPTAHEEKLRATGSAINRHGKRVRAARGAPAPRSIVSRSAGHRVGAS